MHPAKYRRYVLGVLASVYTLNFLDRGVMALLLQPIKTDLHLSDTQLGFLTGIAYALFYAVLGIPIARWADRGDRRALTSVAIGLWGLALASYVGVGNFLQLACARVATAVGESGCAPPTYSLVGDYFPRPAERARAMAVWWLANPLSSLLSFGVAGWLNERVGWRDTFMIVGIPGLLASIVVWFTVREPRREASKTELANSRSSGSWSQVAKSMWRDPPIRHLGLAIILLYTMGLGLAPWYAAFMIRVHGVGTTQLGVWFAAIFGLGGAVGMLAGGYIASRWLSDSPRAQLRGCALAIIGMVPFAVAYLVVPQCWAALLALVPVAILINVIFGPAFALLQRFVPDDSRATTLSIVLFLGNLIGMGLGPQVVGILSDLFRNRLGQAASLRDAMVLLSLVAVGSSVHFWRAGQAVSRLS